MASPLARIGGDARPADADPVVVDLADGDAEAVLDALGSETARELFLELSEEPAPPSELAERADTSVQNVHYHLSNLRAAGVVESLGTRFSEKGNEMNVYGPAADPIVLVGNADRAEHSTLRETLSDWAAAVAGLGLTSLAVQLAFERFAGDAAARVFEPASRGVAAPDGVLGVVLLLAEPGLLFFLGGLAVFALAAVERSEAVDTPTLPSLFGR
jgi:DNA-binding transcriptional ArsR family regulator